MGLRGTLWVQLWEVKKLWVRIMGVTLVTLSYLNNYTLTVYLVKIISYYILFRCFFQE